MGCSWTIFGTPILEHQGIPTNKEPEQHIKRKGETFLPAVLSIYIDILICKTEIHWAGCRQLFQSISPNFPLSCSPQPHCCCLYKSQDTPHSCCFFFSLFFFLFFLVAQSNPSSLFHEWKSPLDPTHCLQYEMMQSILFMTLPSLTIMCESCLTYK